MELKYLAGMMLFHARLQKNWSQETLCYRICDVSYLSKIEQDQVDASDELLQKLFARLGIRWEISTEMAAMRDTLYDSIFSRNEQYISESLKALNEQWGQLAFGPCYTDFLVIRAYCAKDIELIPEKIMPHLDDRQQALVALLQERGEDAYRSYPCASTACAAGEEAYRCSNYPRSLEYFQTAYEQSAQAGYAHLMMDTQYGMFNCYSDMADLNKMQLHGQIAVRLGRALGNRELIDTIDYTIATTKVEFGDYAGAYAYFSNQRKPNVMSLHKLAICCEALGKREEALYALDRADAQNSNNAPQKKMCALIRYRLDHEDYLHEDAYGTLLIDTFHSIRKEMHANVVRFHLPWVTAWLTVNRENQSACDFLQNLH